MLFNSYEFFAFFILVLGCFFLGPRQWQPFVLIVVSYIFYMGWRPSFALLLGLTTVVDYLTGIAMGSARTSFGRSAAMWTALAINLGILGSLKYLDFILSNIALVAGIFDYPIPSFALGLILPVGISFYTFQSIGYTLDVYHRRVAPERNFMTYAQYVCFFPQLVAGPIERAGHMLPQFRARHSLEWENVKQGLWLVGYGLFKKMCVADPVAPVVAAIYDHPAEYGGSDHVVATVMFAFQIYCDFSGYSDIARGIARIMGFELMVNFRQPYFATSLTKFWRTWHISLSSWFRDYLYIPLGGSRGSKTAVERNLMIVFLVSGIWHGAAWTFIIWGGLHGLGLVVERWVGKHKRFQRLASGGLWTLLGWMWTAMVVLVGWVFFRARSLADALTILASFFHPGRLSYYTFEHIGFSSFNILMYGVSLVTMLGIDYCIGFRAEQLTALSRRRWLPTFSGVALVYYVVLFGVMGRVEFIYFQF